MVDSDLEDDQPTSVQKSRKETTGSTKKTEAVTTPLADKRNDKDSKKKTTANNKEKSNRGLSVTPSKSAKKGQEFTAKPTEVINISSDESSDLDTEDEEKPEETSVPFQSQINGSTTAISAKNQVNGTPQDTTAGVEQDTDSEVESNSSSESNEESPSTESPAGNGTKSASEVEKSNYNNSESKSGSESDEARSEAANTPSRALARSR